MQSNNKRGGYNQRGGVIATGELMQSENTKKDEAGLKKKNTCDDKIKGTEGEIKRQKDEGGTVMWSQMLLISCVAVRTPRHSNHESQYR